MVEPGTILGGRYRIVRPVGYGGMGTVFEAQSTLVGRRVAVKVLHEAFAHYGSVVERFQREARIVGSIRSEHVVEIIDVGRHANTHYLVMEYLDGMSLGVLLERHGKLAMQTALRIATQLLSALAAARDAGVVHRDVKPNNVILTRRAGRDDFVKLIDFGIAKCVGEEDRPERGLTQMGTVVGTPQYMPPEQAMGCRDLDHRSDLYAAGTVLYEMLTGVVPFDGNSDTQVLAEVAHRPQGLPPPRSHDPTIPEGLEAVLFKALAAERADRYQSAEEFAEALGPWIAEQSGADNAIEFVSQPSSKLALNMVVSSAQSTPSAVSSVEPAVQHATLEGSMSKETPTESTLRGTRLWRVGFALGFAALSALGLGAAVRWGSAPPQSASRGGSSYAEAALPAPPPATASPAAPPRVSVELTGIPEGAEVSVDGARTTERRLWLMRGTPHTIRVVAPGREPFVTEIAPERDLSIMVASPARTEAPVHNEDGLATSTREPVARVHPLASSSALRNASTSERIVGTDPSMDDPLATSPPSVRSPSARGGTQRHAAPRSRTALRHGATPAALPAVPATEIATELPDDPDPVPRRSEGVLQLNPEY